MYELKSPEDARKLGEYWASVGVTSFKAFMHITRAQLAAAVEEAQGSISYPFDRILVGWLLIIFLCFGLIAPRNALSLVTIMLGALSIASAVLVILDLDTPFTGPIMIGSQPMRDAIGYQSR